MVDGCPDFPFLFPPTFTESIKLLLLSRSRVEDEKEPMEVEQSVQLSFAQVFPTPWELEWPLKNYFVILYFYLHNNFLIHFVRSLSYQISGIKNRPIRHFNSFVLGFRQNNHFPAPTSQSDQFDLFERRSPLSKHFPVLGWGKGKYLAVLPTLWMVEMQLRSNKLKLMRKYLLGIDPLSRAAPAD